MGCHGCKYYEQDEDVSDGVSLGFWHGCRKTNKGNLKGFPFKNVLKCFKPRSVIGNIVLEAMQIVKESNESIKGVTKNGS